MQYQLGKEINQYKSGTAQTLTLVVTEQCNLRCKYCYELHKNSRNKMPREVAYKAIDLFLEKPYPAEAVILEFTGGECTLEIPLMRDIIEYFKARLCLMTGHPWQSAYRIMFGTNGTLYHTEQFQRLLWENREHSAPAITIDGTKRKHDRSRIFADGRGSYDIVAKNVKLWVRQYPNALTKVTFSSDDLPYVSESIIHIWELGVKYVAANVVFEDVWKPGDADLYESELRKLADIAIERGFWKTHRCSLFGIFENHEAETSETNWCGTGQMVSVDTKGNLFPCLRFQQFSLANKPERSLGSVFDGYDEDKLRSFYCLCTSLLSKQECLECHLSSQCAWCTAYNYDVADSSTIFHRATFICGMHKARWRANQYYWEQLRKKHGIMPVEVAAASQPGLCPE